MSIVTQLIQAAPASNIFAESKATTLLKSGNLPPHSIVRGEVRLYSMESLEIPSGLIVESLNLNELSVKFNPGIKVGYLNLNRVHVQDGLPGDLVCGMLDARDTNLREIPNLVSGQERLCLPNCTQLERLPANLKVNVLILRGCAALKTLPEGLSVYFLDISGCTNLRSLPARGAIHHGRLIARNCANLEALPDWLENLSGLDLRNCAKIDRLPPKLKISGWIDIAGTRIKSLPPHLDNVELRWRGAPVDRRIAFQPETITSDDILQARNVEVRRAMLDRVGFERFLELAKAQLLDTDRDKGGERKLLKVAMPSDEDLVCVSFSCPSTGRRYIVRVPPTTRTARAAVAWIAGFDNPGDYRPVLES